MHCTNERFCGLSCAGRPHSVNAVGNKQSGSLSTRASKARRHLLAMRNNVNFLTDFCTQIELCIHIYPVHSRIQRRGVVPLPNTELQVLCDNSAWRMPTHTQRIKAGLQCFFRDGCVVVHYFNSLLAKHMKQDSCTRTYPAPRCC